MAPSPDIHREHLVETFKSLQPIAASALRAVLLTNGGTAGALLAYMGHGASVDFRPPALYYPMTCFIGGVAAAGLGHVTAYLTQLALYNESRGMRLPWWCRHPLWLWISVGLAVLGLIAFAAGALCAARTLSA